VQRLCDHVVVVSHGRVMAQGSVEDLCQRAGHADFEETFVSLAFGPDVRPDGP
jgi:sodium transport system ATP-binding protein